MKTFLCKHKKPVAEWGMLPNGTYFKGDVPNGYELAISPSTNIIILDIDCKNGKNGLINLPFDIFNQLVTFGYRTPSGGYHIWLKYTGDKVLYNRSTDLGIDLRVGSNDNSNGGYVIWYPRDKISPFDINDFIFDTNEDINEWLELLFS